jgi:hypothetical protein
LAAACGTHCTSWEDSAIAYWYRVIAAGAVATLAGSVRGGDPDFVMCVTDLV